jgi:hypothetical protein
MLRQLSAFWVITSSVRIVVTRLLSPAAAAIIQETPMSDDYGSIDCLLTPTRQKDPASTQDFTLNWAQELNGQTISTSTWATDGLTGSNTSNTDTSATIRLAGGTEGAYYEVRNTIITSGGQTLAKQMVVAIRKLH